MATILKWDDFTFRFPNGDRAEQDSEGMHAWQKRAEGTAGWVPATTEECRDADIIWCAKCGITAVGTGLHKVVHRPSFAYGDDGAVNDRARKLANNILLDEAVELFKNFRPEAELLRSLARKVGQK